MKTRLDFHRAWIVNPKRHADAGGAQDARLFPYYVGYSSAFASTLLASLNLQRNACILDPWNGSGITTQTARRLGYRAIGRDLNPVMVLIAKAESLAPTEVGRLLPTAHQLITSAQPLRKHFTKDDPLTEWLVPSTASFIRALEMAIRSTLTSAKGHRALLSRRDVDRISSLAAFFYVALFGVARRLLGRFKATNPMWTKSPAQPHLRLKVPRAKVASLFLDQVKSLSALIAVHSFLVTDRSRTSSIAIGNSETLPLKSRSVDFVLTSPPYCTRVDYAVATVIELAVLRFTTTDFSTLRRSLMGTSTVSPESLSQMPDWGKTCNRFLNRLYRHNSKASQTYYFKNHLQYFHSLYASIRAISRVLKSGGGCVIVVQDSYYKDIHNDVPRIVREMAHAQGLALQRRETFVSRRSMVDMNKRARKYVSKRQTKESVMCFVQTRVSP